MPLWLQVLSKACVDGGEMVLLTDDSQNIYGTAKARTDDKMREAGFYVTPNRLKTSYRLSSDTARLAQKFGELFLPKDIYDPPLTAQNSMLGLSFDHLRWVQCSAIQASEICADELISLMKKTGDHSLSNADITLITSRITDGDEVTAHLKRKYNINTRNTYDHDKQRSRAKKWRFSWVIRGLKQPQFIALKDGSQGWWFCILLRLKPKKIWHVFNLRG